MSARISAVTRESNASANLDLGVVIDRIRVIANASSSIAAAQFDPDTMSLRPLTTRAVDCRIYIGELTIEAPEALDHAAAYQLGCEVAQGLVVALSNLQDERLQRLLYSHGCLGPVAIGAVRARLGTLETPSAHVICRELLAAIEGRLVQ